VPVFRNIAAKVLPYLGVMPSVPNSTPGPNIRTANASSSPVKQASGSKKPAGQKPGAKSAQKTALKKSASIKSSGVVPIVAKKIQPAPKREAPEKYSLKIDEREPGAY
jgi:hypothetical protein